MTWCWLGLHRWNHRPHFWSEDARWDPEFFVTLTGQRVCLDCRSWNVWRTTHVRRELLAGVPSEDEWTQRRAERWNAQQSLRLVKP